jgi:hypothetical protein
MKVSHRLNDLKRRALKSVRGKDAPADKLAREDVESLVKRAYLRSLSRYPNPEEIERCTEFIEQSENPLDGLRDLVWALINTKEFIVNH